MTRRAFRERVDRSKNATDYRTTPEEHDRLRQANEARLRELGWDDARIAEWFGHSPDVESDSLREAPADHSR